jgi:hypothetical protein
VRLVVLRWRRRMVLLLIWIHPWRGRRHRVRHLWRRRLLLLISRGRMHAHVLGHVHRRIRRIHSS